VLGVATADLFGFAHGFQPFVCVLPDEVEQEEAFLPLVDEALLHQRGERVELGVADRFGGVEREAAGAPRTCNGSSSSTPLVVRSRFGFR
jgi:hypothetical protein